MTAEEPSAPAGPRQVSRRTMLGGGAALLTLVGCSPRSRSAADSVSSTSAVPGTSSSTVSAPATTSAQASAKPTLVPHTGPATEIMRGSGHRPEVALTFHGAGDPSTATAILQTLNRAGAKSTIMAVGTWVQANPQLVRSFAANGHELGNHTWSHPTLPDLDRAPADTEIRRCRDQLRSVTGGPGLMFRQSGAQHSTALIRELAGAAGYRVCLSYDIDSLDWTDPGADAIRTNTATATAGSIVSLHLGHAGTVTALPAILADLADRNLKPVTATALLTA